MTPARYQRLRRLKLVRADLRRSSVERYDPAEIVTRYGFADIHGFVAEYWQAYGEMPTIPPRRSASR